MRLLLFFSFCFFWVMVLPFLLVDLFDRKTKDGNRRK
jgi:hypothetical protein